MPTSDENKILWQHVIPDEVKRAFSRLLRLGLLGWDQLLEARRRHLFLDVPSSILRPMVWAPASAFLSKLVLPGFFSSCTSDIERFGAGGADAATTHLGEVGPDAPDSFDDELRCRVTLRSDENVLSESASAMKLSPSPLPSPPWRTAEAPAAKFLSSSAICSASPWLRRTTWTRSV